MPQLQQHAPAVLLLWRAATMAMQTGARRAVDAKARKFSSTAVSWTHPSSHTGAAHTGPLPRSHADMPGAAATAPFATPVFAAATAAAGAAMGSGARSMSNWAGLRSRLAPAVRMAVPVTAAAVAAGAHGHFTKGAAAPDLHDPALAAAGMPAVLTHGLPAATVPMAPADMRACRELLDERGFAHPGMQPGAAWGAIPATVGSNKQSGEMHVMFEYLLLFPA